MDIDAMGKHVQGLLKFKQEFEQLLRNAGHDIAGETGSVSAIDRLAAAEGHLTELGETVAGIQQQLESLPDLVEGLAGVKDMAAWFAENRSGLEVLLSIGDDATGGGNGGATGTVSGNGAGGTSTVYAGTGGGGGGSAGGASGEAGSPTGEGSDAGGTEGTTGGANPSPAS